MNISLNGKLKRTFLRSWSLIDHLFLSFYRFECPDINTRDTNKCHLKGKSYNVSEKAHQDDLPYCTAQCICLQHKDENNENYKPAAFNCAEIECPEHFGGRDWSCVSQYANIRDCCRTNEVCGEAGLSSIR